MAQGCSSQSGMGRSEPHAVMMEGLRCKCESKSMSDDYVFTERACDKIGKTIRYCWGKAQDYCETEDRDYDFRFLCALRGPDCWVEAC